MIRNSCILANYILGPPLEQKENLDINRLNLFPLQCENELNNLLNHVILNESSHI